MSYVILFSLIGCLLLDYWYRRTLEKRIKTLEHLYENPVCEKVEEVNVIGGLDIESIDIKIVNDLIKTDNRFSVPTRATIGSAAIDLKACIDEPIVIKAQQSVLVGTGIAVNIKDPRFAGMILPRSGLGSKEGIVLGNLTGLIDSDYQGELMVSVWNRSWEDYVLEPATRFAQFMVVPVSTPRFNLVEEFNDKTVRGNSGFGSSGI